MRADRGTVKEAGGVDCPMRARVDLGALAGNLRLIARRAGGAQVMAMVKANAYGHGMVPCAVAALDAGATWLGVAQLHEALALRAGLDAVGRRGHILAGISVADAPYTAALAGGIDLTVSTTHVADQIATAAQEVGVAARVHLKVDTGMSRGGCQPAAWPDLLSHVRRHADAGRLEIIGIYSHFACADEPGHPSIAAQQRAFDQALEVAAAAGVRPQVRHLANSAAVLTGLDACYDLVRPGIALYGLAPNPGVVTDPGLVPVMCLEAELAMVKQVGAGQGVSYGYTYITAAPTTLGLVPLGYGDGIARSASGRGQVQVAGQRARIAGRVCMDQFVVDLGPDSPAQVGDRVVLFGAGHDGEPTADDWAAASQTINYEVVTRISERVPRVYEGQE